MIIETMTDRPPRSDRTLIQYVLRSAIRCFFHVYEERVGTYDFRVLKHVLIYPGTARDPMTGCNRDVDPHEYVTVSNDIIVDSTWCRTCAAAVDKEALRGHSPTHKAIT
jgi:hypothetical protein